MGIFSQKRQPYKIVEQNDEDKTLLFSEPGFDKPRRRRSVWKIWVSRFFWTLSMIGNVVLASALVALIYKPSLFKQRKTVDEKFTYRSASFDTEVKQINGTLFPTANQSWSRLAPNPEVDKLWSWFDPPRFIPLSEDDMHRLGKDTATCAKFPPEWNQPEGSYMGAVDLFHKMHCLNELRRAAFEDAPREVPKEHIEKERLDWIHLRHCTDMIAQDLQCNAKLDIMTFNYMDTQANIYPDFSIKRTCTNWDQFVDWNEKNTLNSLDFPTMIDHPAGITLIPAQDAYYETYGFGGSVLFPDGKGWTPHNN